MPTNKEAHVFDDPRFEESWGRERIDEEYARHFESRDDGRLYGDATPIYLFHPTLISRIAAYNPAMRWIVLLREPVERAISQYHMERARGDEQWPLWAALAFERWRLRGHWDDWSPGSPLRHWSYRARGGYAAQLRMLRLHFPESQILVIHNPDLRSQHSLVLTRVCRFLSIPDFSPMPSPIAAFEGEAAPVSAAARWLAAYLLRRESRDYKAM